MVAPWRAEISGTTGRGYGGEGEGGARATRSTADRAPRPVPGLNPIGRSRSSPPANASCGDRKSTRLNSSHLVNLVCRLLLEKKKKRQTRATKWMMTQECWVHNKNHRH